MKKGDIWISTVIYIGLGIVAISILVGAGVPLISKMKDRNTFFQTKEIMQTIDRAITEVASEGPGSRRFLSPLDIKRGHIDILSNKIQWRMETKAILQQPGQTIKEGDLHILVKEHSLIKDLYETEITLDYFASQNILLCINGDCAIPSLTDLQGQFSLSFTHEGVENGNTKIVVKVT